jgi:hypothetical protein
LFLLTRWRQSEASIHTFGHTPTIDIISHHYKLHITSITYFRPVSLPRERAEKSFNLDTIMGFLDKLISKLDDDNAAKPVDPHAGGYQQQQGYQQPQAGYQPQAQGPSQGMYGAEQYGGQGQGQGYGQGQGQDQGHGYGGGYDQGQGQAGYGHAAGYNQGGGGAGYVDMGAQGQGFPDRKSSEIYLGTR